MRNKKLNKILSVALSAVMLGATLFTGNPAKAETSDPLIEDETYAGNKGYIKTFLATDYMNSEKNGFQLKFEYTALSSATATPAGTAEDDTESKEPDYNDTLEFLVFDTNWEGWEATTIGPNGVDQTGEVTPEVGVEYTVDVPFSVIDDKLTKGKMLQGINLETGTAGNCTIKINSLTYADVEEEARPVVTSEPVLIEGDWHKVGDKGGDYGSMELVEGSAYVSADAWNIGITNLNVSTFTSPMIAVTVEYGEIEDPPIYPQAEVLKSNYQAIIPNYPQVSEAGEVTYLTPISSTTWSVILAYDTCTVKKVQIFDYDEDYATDVYDLTNANIIEKMGAGWNLGNALDAVTEDGVVSETAWGNPEVTKYLFKVVSEAGFKTVRIPVSWVDCVSVTGDTYSIKSKFTERLDRVQEVVDWARDYDLFVIINIQHDGADDVTDSWLDVDAANQTGIRAAFADVWGRIAERFKEYDQHLIFESMNEVMEKGNYGAPSQTTWDNINYLNQSFVNTVRGKSGHNDVRFLLIPGYNTNIDQTVTDNFEVPEYKHDTDYTMVSVHFYDPYNFTLNTGNGSTLEASRSELEAIGTQFAKLKDKFVKNEIPVVIGEFGAVNKDNIPAIKEYISTVVQEAKDNGLAYIYWDNGYTGEYGMGLWNRYTYGESELGKALIPILVPSTGSSDSETAE